MSLMFLRSWNDNSEEIWKHDSSLTQNVRPSDFNNNTREVRKVAASNTLTSNSYRHTPNHVGLPPPPRFASYRDSSAEYEALLNVRAQPAQVQANDVRHQNKHLVKPVKRTASMPAKAFPPDYRRQHGANDRDGKQPSNGSSQRPGRGVFADSGKRIHGRQKQNDERPPRFVARGVQGNGRSVSTERAGQLEPRGRIDSEELELPNTWARRHTGNPDWSYSSSETSPKPIDQLRNRVRLQQEKEQQRNNQNSQRPSSSPAERHTQSGYRMNQHHNDQDETDFGFQKQSPQRQVTHSIGPSKISRKSRKDGYDAQSAPQHHMKQQYPRPNEEQTVQFRSRAISPSQNEGQRQIRHNGVVHHAVTRASRSVSPEKGRSPTHHQVPQQQPSYITRTVSPERSRASREYPTNVVSQSVPKYSTGHPPYSTEQLAERLNQSAAVTTHHQRPKTVVNGTDHLKHAASNKYKMLVCPDFFPVAKLNGLPKRKSRIDVLIEDEVVVDDVETVNSPQDQEMDGFYKRRTNNMKPAQPQIQMDDSFVEDPREQLLYPTNKQTGRGRPLLKDSPNFYFEVSPARNSRGASNSASEIPDRGVFATLQASSPQWAAEGDSLFSVHTSQQSPENGAHLPTSEGSETSPSMPSNKRRSSPPPYQQAIHRTQSTRHYVEQIKPYGDDKEQQLPIEKHTEHTRTNLIGQQGRTAKVISLVEPKEHEEVSHYSAISVYRNTSSRQTDKPKPMSVRPTWNHTAATGEQPNNRHDALKKVVKSHSTERSSSANVNIQQKSINNSAPVVPSRMKNLQMIPSSSPNDNASLQSRNIPPRSSHPREPSASRDDKLLEHIKAQHSQPPSNFVVSQRQMEEQPYQRIPVEENHYENLKSVAKSVRRIKTAESRTQHPVHTLNAVANPDYMYIPTMSQREAPEQQLKSSRSKPEFVSSTPLEHTPNQIPQTFQTLEKRATTYSHHRQPHLTVAANNPRPDLSGNYQVTPTAAPDNASLSHSSTTGSVSDGSLGHRKEMGFVEPPKSYSIRDEEDDAFQSDNSNSVEVLADTEQPAMLRVHAESVPGGERAQLSSVSDNGSAMSEDKLGEQLAQSEKDVTSKKATTYSASNNSRNRGKGLGDDILSITKMWKNLPTDDSWDAKRRALLDDPIMSAISEKMEAILQTSSDKDELTEQGRTTLSVRNEALTDHGLVSPQSPSDVGLVTREPGEGSSDDLDESIDLSMKKSHRMQQNQLSQSKVLAASSNQSEVNRRNVQPPQRSGIPVRTKSNLQQMTLKKTDQEQLLDERDEGIVEVKQVRIVEPSSDEDNDGDDELSADLFKVKRQPGKPLTSAKRESETSMKKALSESEESDEEGDFSVQGADHQEESDESDDEAPDEGVKYLSDYHRSKSKPKARSPPKKKISFSSDARRSRPGDLLTSNNAETLLSVNPFMTSSPTLEKPSNVLLSMNPFMTDVEQGEGSVGASPDSEMDHSLCRKPRQGILKRSEDGAGSQISLGTCSEFGSHISLASVESGMSRAGSFPLLTMSDGSKKDFKITFNDTDTSDMSNLFKVVRKARSEGAASEPESTDSESDDDAMPVTCKNCHSKQPLFKARLIYKMCHGCYTYYCSSECRRQDWTAHKPLCIVSRLSSLARKIFKCVMTDQELLHHCSRFARTGYLCEGRGAVVLSFSSPRKAQLFLSNAKQAKESALYLCVKDLQKFSFDDKRDKDQLISNCKHYNPDEKFVLHLAIKMNKTLSGQTVEPRIRGREFHKWARIRLSEKHNVPKGDRFNEEDTLILTALSTTPDQSTIDPPDAKVREVFFANVLTKLRKRGISLRHQYPDVYNALCQYVTSGKTFAPISLFAFNLNTQKRFMCCIMPYSDPDVTWGNNPHLMEDLDLAVTL